jgi:WD40 repeat protein
MVCVWALERSTPLQTFAHVHQKTIQSLVKMNGRFIIASASNDGKIQLYQSETLALLETITSPPTLHQPTVPIYALQTMHIMDQSSHPSTKGKSQPSMTSLLVAATGHGQLWLFPRVDDNAAVSRNSSPNATAAHHVHEPPKETLQLHSAWMPLMRVRGHFIACVAESTLFIVDGSDFHLKLVAEVDTHHGLVHSIEWLNGSTVLTCGCDGLIKSFQFQLPVH